MDSLSAYGVTHPPRSKPPLRSSSAPPSPCITPSTVTIVRVVSFMVAVPFSLSSSSFDPTGPRRDLTVLLNRHREHRPALFRVTAAAAEGPQRRLRLPALEDVDTGGRPVRADRDVEAANCPRCVRRTPHRCSSGDLV